MKGICGGWAWSPKPTLSQDLFERGESPAPGQAVDSKSEPHSSKLMTWWYLVILWFRTVLGLSRIFSNFSYLRNFWECLRRKSAGNPSFFFSIRPSVCLAEKSEPLGKDDTSEIKSRYFRGKDWVSPEIFGVPFLRSHLRILEKSAQLCIFSEISRSSADMIRMVFVFHVSLAGKSSRLKWQVWMFNPYYLSHFFERFKDPHDSTESIVFPTFGNLDQYVSSFISLSHQKQNILIWSTPFWSRANLWLPAKQTKGHWQLARLSLIFFSSHLLSLGRSVSLSAWLLCTLQLL